MKKKLTNNLALKLGSVLVGFLVWLFVVNIDNPIITSSYSIPLSNIEVINDAYIDSTGKMFMLDENQNVVRVHVTGDRKTIRRIAASDIRVIADLQQAVSLDTDPVMIPISAFCDGILASNIEVTPNNIMVHLKDKLTQEFVVNVSGGDSKPGKGYEIGEMTAEPEKIKITGPSTLVNKISTVTTTVNVDGITKDQVVDAHIKIVDKNGDVLPESQMKYLNVVRTVSVTTKLWKIRSNVKIKAEYSGEPAKGFRIESITTVPDVLNLAGNEEGLEKLSELGNVITISKDAIQIQGASSDIEEKINISEFLPDGIIVAGDAGEDVWIHVNILPEDSVTYKIATKDIAVKNLKKNLQVAFETDKIEIRVRGDMNQDNLDLNEIKAYIDLEGKEAGNYDAPVYFELPEGYSLVNDVTAEVKVSAIQE